MVIRLDDMKNKFSEEEISLLQALASKGSGVISFCPSYDFEFSEFLWFKFFVQNEIPELEDFGFIKLGMARFNPEKYTEDVFLNTYCRLIKDGAQDKAEELAKLCGFDILNVLYKDGMPAKDIWKFDQMPFSDASFGKDLLGCLEIEIEIYETLIKFVSKYWGNDKEPKVYELPIYEDIYFDEEKSLIFIPGIHRPIEISKISRQYEFLKVVFSNVNKDWQFSEVAEEMEHDSEIDWKILHNYASAVKTKIAVYTPIRDFFITTTQSVRINPQYIKRDPLKSGFDDF